MHRWIAAAALVLLAAHPSERQRAEHALSRLGFGARPGDVERVLRIGVDRWIELQLHPERIDDRAVDARVARYMNDVEIPPRDDKQMLRRTARKAVADASAQRILRAAESERQLNEVMVDFWMNHFNVFAGKGLDRFLVASYERDAIRPRVWGRFADLLMATAKSPAMLFYLDNVRSRSGALNENYARELMEGECAYAASRPSIAIPRNEVLDLDGFFGVHPSMKPLLPFWKDRSLAAVHAVGSPDATRSHFEAQDFMESGTPGVKSTKDGFVARALGKAKTSTPRAVALFASAYPEAFEAARVLGSVDAGGGPLKQIASLIRADVGVEVAFTDSGGWDTHAAQSGPLANNLRRFSDDIAAFANELGSRMSDVVLVTMSEFGRTVRENGTRGTDHGHGGAMLVLGGNVRGGKVHGRWPGLEREQLFEGRDLAVTTDFRDVFAEVLTAHLGVESMANVFPRHPVRPVGVI